ncbi:MAG: bacillithiol biosynthesis deacetylase BshB1 [Gemmatimonadetes bacterium]|nr:bacillithiol biosynthesis deacetylase BshB1 [Gemmatimonadota bacterium]MDA1104081.1 bacillithiol biosynthesis deacetylase BshB1 [Gemmatimonadota bacterium]
MPDTAAPLDILAIMAHPDDAELLCGGALIKSAGRGRRVGVLDLTAGEMGSSGSVATRSREATASAAQMGLVHRRCAGLPDSALENDSGSRRIVAEHIRALRPDIVITHWRVGRHRDHRVASELVRDACFLSGLHKLDVAGEPFRPNKLVYATAFREDAGPPDFVIDITEQLERKLDVISLYASQFDGVRQAGEVYPGGDRPLLEQIRVQMAHYGSLIRVRYGEPFRVDEALEVDELSSLGVSTF